MTTPPGESGDRIPLGDDFFLDLSSATMGSYSVAETSEVAAQCFEDCNPGDIADYFGHQAIAEFCMMNAMQGGGQTETLFELDIHCKGPKRGLFKQKCGAKVAVKSVVLPIDKPEAE